MKRFRFPIYPIVFAIGLTAFAYADISHRKADLTVLVQSNSGTPLEGATIEIEMLNHAFRFGSAVQHRFIDPNSNQYNPTVVENLQKYFNSMTYGNAMKWTYFERNTEEENLALITLPQSYNAFDSPDPLRVRGHVTIWGSAYQVPTRVKNSSDPDYIHEQILNHVQAYHTTFKDAGIDNYDLHNEPLHERAELMDKIITSGNVADEAAKIAEWFNKAKEADPDAILFVNDYNILNANWVANHGAAREYKEYIDAIRDAGGQIDGIGVQAHMGQIATRENLKARIDILAAPMEPTENHPNGLPGLPIEITEFDITETDGSPNDQVQATQTRDMLEVAFEHPSVIGVTIWGMNDGNHWRDNAIMFDDSDPNNWIIKPSGQEWVDLVTQEWWEDHDGTSSSNGEYTANTIKGTHRVTVIFNGETKEQIVNLSETQNVAFNFAATADDATTYDQWASFIDWQGADSSRDADPDGDGNSNLKEYFYRQDPLILQTSDPRTYLSSDQTNGQTLDYFARAAIQSIDVEVLFSTDLESWSPIQDISWLDASPSLETVNVNGASIYRLNIGKNTGFFKLKFSER